MTYRLVQKHDNLAICIIISLDTKNIDEPHSSILVVNCNNTNCHNSPKLRCSNSVFRLYSHLFSTLLQTSLSCKSVTAESHCAMISNFTTKSLLLYFPNESLKRPKTITQLNTTHILNSKTVGVY